MEFFLGQYSSSATADLGNLLAYICCYTSCEEIPRNFVYSPWSSLERQLVLSPSQLYNGKFIDLFRLLINLCAAGSKHFALFLDEAFNMRIFEFDNLISKPLAIWDEPFHKLKAFIDNRKLLRVVRISWKWGDRFIRKVIEPFIQAMSPIRIPSEDKDKGIFNNYPDEISINCFKNEVLRRTLLACTPDVSRALIEQLDFNLGRSFEERFKCPGELTLFSLDPAQFGIPEQIDGSEGGNSGNGLQAVGSHNFSQPASPDRPEEDLLALSDEWREFAAALTFSFQQREAASTSTPLGCYARRFLYNYMNTISIPKQIRPFRQRCAQLRELSRFTIWFSILNNTNAEYQSLNVVSLRELFCKLGLPQLLIRFLEFQ